MSIVKGASGRLQASEQVISSSDYSVLMWVKDPVAESGVIFHYANAPAASIELDYNSDSLRHRLRQASNAAVVEGTTATAGAWLPVVFHASTSRQRPEITTANGDTGEGSFAGSFVAPSSPALNIFTDGSGFLPVADGFKVGVIAVYSRQLTLTERTELVGGAAPEDYAGLTAYWSDGQGVVSDGSDNLVGWTDSVSSYVLSPSGVVTVDDADGSPVSGPSVDSAPSTHARGQAGLTMQVSNVEAGITVANSELRIGGAGGAELTVTSVVYDDADTVTVTYSVPVGIDALHSSVGYPVYANLNNQTVLTSAIPLTAQSGWGYVSLLNAVEHEDNLISEVGGAADDGMQIFYELTTSGGYGYSVNDKAFAAIDFGDDSVSAQTVNAGWVNADGTYNAPIVINYPYSSTVDTTPDPMTIPAQTNVALDASIQSAPITVVGVDAGEDIPVSIVGGVYQVSTNGGSTWGGETDAATSVQLNYQIRVLLQSSALNSTQTTATLTVGGVDVPFNVTTLADQQAIGELSDTFYTDANDTTPYTTAGVKYWVIDSSDEVVLAGTVNPTNAGVVTLTGAALIAGSYLAVFESSDGSTLAAKKYTVS